jgi:hypothetical protein
MAERRRKRIENALDAAKWATVDGDHHKAWVIDQMVRALLPDRGAYDRWVQDFEYGEDGAHTYEWDVGTPP